MNLDLLDKRRERSGWENGTARTFTITAGELVLGTLGPELPLTALEPLKAIDSELALLFGKVVSTAGGKSSRDELTQDLMDFVVAYPDLPARAVHTAIAIGEGILGKEGVDNFLSLHPSFQDVVALVSGITEWYGVSVGESSGSSDSSTDDGTTSTTTSEPTSESTPETPSEEQTTTG